MLRVGLTGGIGSGKSTVSAQLATYGAVVVDSDVLAREVVEPGTAGLAAVVAAFGPQVLDDTGRLDRAALGARVFSAPDELARLNAVVHPLVRDRARQLTEQAAAEGVAVLVQDVPLLVETGQQSAYDEVVVVDAPVERQLERLVSLRGMTPQDAQARIDRQAGREQRRAAATVVLVNDGSAAHLARQVEELWASWQRRVR